METGNEIKDFNIAEALKYAPKGLKLYSPIFGEVELHHVSLDKTEIHVSLSNSTDITDYFHSDGRFYNDSKDAECLLFPSINHRCWNNWQNTLFLESIGSVCVDTVTGYKFILGEGGTYFSDNTGGYYSVIIENDLDNYLLNSRYASPEEAKEFFEELEKNGYEWNGKMVVKSTSQPKFKVGDVIKHNPTGEIGTIKEVCINYYVFDDNSTLYFEAQDMWELVASKVEVVPQDKVPTSLEIYYAANNIKPLEEKVSILTDEILALKERVKALELQVIRTAPPMTEDPYFKSNKITCDDAQCYKGKSASDVFKTPDKAGDNVTLEEMNG